MNYHLVCPLFLSGSLGSLNAVTLMLGEKLMEKIQRYLELLPITLLLLATLIVTACDSDGGHSSSTSNTGDSGPFNFGETVNASIKTDLGQSESAQPKLTAYSSHETGVVDSVNFVADDKQPLENIVSTMIVSTSEAPLAVNSAGAPILTPNASKANNSNTAKVETNSLSTPSTQIADKKLLKKVYQLVPQGAPPQLAKKLATIAVRAPQRRNVTSADPIVSSDDFQTIVSLLNKMFRFPKIKVLWQTIIEVAQKNPEILTRLEFLLQQIFNVTPGNEAMDALQKLLLQQVEYSEGDLGQPVWVVAFDSNENPEVMCYNGAMVKPFIDTNGDGICDTDALGRPINAQGQPLAISIFGDDEYYDASGQLLITRDQNKRAITPDGKLVYHYYDGKSTILSILYCKGVGLLTTNMITDAFRLIGIAFGPRQKYEDEHGTYYGLATDTHIVKTLDGAIKLFNKKDTRDLIKGFAILAEKYSDQYVEYEDQNGQTQKELYFVYWLKGFAKMAFMLSEEEVSSPDEMAQKIMMLILGHKIPEIDNLMQKMMEVEVPGASVPNMLYLFQSWLGSNMLEIAGEVMMPLRSTLVQIKIQSGDPELAARFFYGALDALKWLFTTKVTLNTGKDQVKKTLACLALQKFVATIEALTPEELQKLLEQLPVLMRATLKSRLLNYALDCLKEFFGYEDLRTTLVELLAPNQDPSKNVHQDIMRLSVSLLSSRRTLPGKMHLTEALVNFTVAALVTAINKEDPGHDPDPVKPVPVPPPPPPTPNPTPSPMSPDQTKTLFKSLYELVANESLPQLTNTMAAIIDELNQDQANIAAMAEFLDSRKGENLSNLLELVNKVLSYQNTPILWQTVATMVQQDPELLKRLLFLLYHVLNNLPNEEQTVQLAELLLQQVEKYQEYYLGRPLWLVKLDNNNNPVVMSYDGQLVAPFIDRDGNGLCDTDQSGRPVDAQGKPLTILPFAADSYCDSQGQVLVKRDELQRAITADGKMVYDYYDAKKTILAIAANKVVTAINSGILPDIFKVANLALGPVRQYQDQYGAYNGFSGEGPLPKALVGAAQLLKKSETRSLLKGMTALMAKYANKYKEYQDAAGNKHKELYVVHWIKGLAKLATLLRQDPNATSEQTAQKMMILVLEHKIPEIDDLLQKMVKIELSDSHLPNMLFLFQLWFTENIGEITDQVIIPLRQGLVQITTEANDPQLVARIFYHFIDWAEWLFTTNVTVVSGNQPIKITIAELALQKFVQTLAAMNQQQIEAKIAELQLTFQQLVRSRFLALSLSCLKDFIASDIFRITLVDFLTPRANPAQDIHADILRELVSVMASARSIKAKIHLFKAIVKFLDPQLTTVSNLIEAINQIMAVDKELIIYRIVRRTFCACPGHEKSAIAIFAQAYIDVLRASPSYDPDAWFKPEDVHCAFSTLHQFLVDKQGLLQRVYRIIRLSKRSRR